VLWQKRFLRRILSSRSFWNYYDTLFQFENIANELPFASNANMLFNEKSLEPMYKLILGQAGSSFTFEVAQKNGIPFGLINRAKKKIEGGKVRFDKTIATLQKERSKWKKLL
jgi:DNA mismatch repair protein MutS2